MTSSAFRLAVIGAVSLSLVACAAQPGRPGSATAPKDVPLSNNSTLHNGVFIAPADGTFEITQIVPIEKDRDLIARALRRGDGRTIEQDINASFKSWFAQNDMLAPSEAAANYVLTPRVDKLVVARGETGVSYTSDVFYVLRDKTGAVLNEERVLFEGIQPWSAKIPEGSRPVITGEQIGSIIAISLAGYLLGTSVSFAPSGANAMRPNPASVLYAYTNAIATNSERAGRGVFRVIEQEPMLSGN